MLNIKDKSINSLITILNKRINSIRLGNEKVYLEFDNIKGLYDVTLKEKVVIVYINKEITADEREYIKNTIKNIYNRESIIKITLNDSIIPDGFIYDNLGILVKKEKVTPKNTYIYYVRISDKWLFIKSKVYSKYHDIYQFEIESFDPVTKESRIELCSAETIGKWGLCVSFLMNSLAVNTNEEFKKDLTTLFTRISSENEIPDKITIPYMGWNENNTEFFPYSDKLNIDFTGDTSKYLKNTIKAFQPKGEINKFINKLKNFINDNYDSDFIISEKFAAPLIDIIGIRSFSINYYGKSGTFKSLANKFGIACFGDPEKLSSSGGHTKLVLMEKLAKFHNLPFYIDEIKEETIDIYGVGNESGRQRLNKNAQIMESVTWRTIMSCTSEHSMEKDSNKEGEINRVICLSVDCVPKNLKNLDDFSKEEFARDNYLFIKNNYGQLGELYIQEVIKLKPILNNIYQEILNKIYDKNKNKQHLYMIASISLANYIYRKLFFDIDDINYSIKLGKIFVKKLQDIENLDSDIKMLRTIIEFYDINENAFKITGKEFKCNYCYGAVREDQIYFILNPLKEYLEKKGFNWNDKKSLIDRGLIEYKNARIDNELKKRIIVNTEVLTKNKNKTIWDNMTPEEIKNDLNSNNDLPLPPKIK